MITKKDLNGLELKFGEDEALLEFVRMMGDREGIGDIFANGILSVLEKWPGARRFATHSKGLEQSAYDTRSAPDMVLAYATCDVGGHHNRAWTIFRAKKFGPNVTDEDIAKLVIYHQHIRPVFDSLGVCRFPWIELGYPEENYAKFYTAATGVESTLDDLLARSERIYNLTRAINTIRGATRESEYPPERTVADPVKSGVNKGAKIDLKKYEKLLDTYYELRGWDKKTGFPTRKKLKELRMDDVADKLHELGKI
jgi:aldehyde:ferredoxin oxidoreductase